MKFLRRLLVGALCVGSLHGFSLDRNAFTFTHYYLNLHVEPEQQRLAVRGRITLRNDSDVAQKIAVLQVSSSLDWRSISVAGAPVQFVSQLYTSDIDHTGALSEAIVTLPKEVPPRGTIDLQIGYEGVVPTDATRLTRIGVPEEKAKLSDWDHISSASSAVRGIGYVTWYPVATEAANLSEGNSVFQTVGQWKAKEAGSEMLLSFAATNGQTVLASGTPTNSIAIKPSPEDNSKYTSFDLANPGVATPMFLMGEYGLVETQPSMKVYYLPGHEKAAKTYANEAANLDSFVSWLGNGHENVSVADAGDPNAAPFESGQLLITPLSTDTQFMQINLVHALAHMHLASPRPWIDEGLAHFVQAQWREQQAGRQAALDYMGLHRTALAEAEKMAGAQKEQGAKQSLISTTQEEYYRSKAMFVWWMLRDMVGDTVFRKAIASYEPDHDMQPSYVQKLFEKQSHRDLEWFFDDWVYRDRGLPDFRVASAYTRPLLNGTYLVTVTVENLGTAGAEVPVRVRIQGNDVISRVEVRGKSTGVVRVEAPSQPQEVIVNDGSVPESDTENNSFKLPVAKP